MRGKLFNTLNHAKREHQLERRDALLEELRELARSYPDDTAVRKQLAMGLYNALVYAKEEHQLERRDTLLGELRELARSHPDDSAVREPLAKGFVLTVLDAEDGTATAQRSGMRARNYRRSENVSRTTQNSKRV